MGGNRIITLYLSLNIRRLFVVIETSWTPEQVNFSTAGGGTTVEAYDYFARQHSKKIKYRKQERVVFCSAFRDKHIFFVITIISAPHALPYATSFHLGPTKIFAT